MSQRRLQGFGGIQAASVISEVRLGGFLCRLVVSFEKNVALVGIDISENVSNRSPDHRCSSQVFIY